MINFEEELKKFHPSLEIDDRLYGYSGRHGQRAGKRNDRCRREERVKEQIYAVL